MQLKKFNILIGLFLGCSLLANDTLDEKVLSQNKQDFLKYSYEKASEDSSKLSKDWINPIIFKYIYNEGEVYTTKKSHISITQPIFKSGGIYFAIKYASSMESFSKLSIDEQKKELIKNVLNLLLQIKKLDITIQKQKLLILNSSLDIEQKKDQVLSGTLNTSYLDNAILDSNTKQNTLIDLELQKHTLVNNLSVLSDKKYEQVEIPRLTLVNEDNFISNNISIKKAQKDIDTAYWLKQMKISNYLPTVNFTADYSKYSDTDGNNQLPEEAIKNVGFNVTIPLDLFTTLNTIQSAKLAYLQKKSAFEDNRLSQLALFKTSQAKVNSIDAKIKIAQNNVKLYSSLLSQMIEQQEVGIKSEVDVQTLSNSKKIKALDIKSLDIEKQLELLEIYSRLNNG